MSLRTRDQRVYEAKKHAEIAASLLPEDEDGAERSLEQALEALRGDDQ